MRYRRMPIEVESPEERGYQTIACNLAESSVADRRLGDLARGLDEVLLCYGDHRGHPGLRARIAELAGPGVGPEHVLLAPGAAAALFFAHMALVGPGDRLVVAHPNYGTNLETPRGIGAEVVLLEQRFEDGFRLDAGRLEALVTKGTRLVSLTSPHNPSGRLVREEDLDFAIALAERAGACLLYDETYRELVLEGEPPPSAAARSLRAITVSSLSKAYGLPGLRLGWLICRDPFVYERLLAAKEQVVICCSAIDEEIGFRALGQRAVWLAEARARLRVGLGILRRWIAAEPRMEWVEPEGGAVAVARIRAEVRLDLDRFYRVLEERHRTAVGPGHWFELERRAMRLGFGWPGPDELSRGLACISLALDEATAEAAADAEAAEAATASPSMGDDGPAERM